MITLSRRGDGRNLALVGRTEQGEAAAVAPMREGVVAPSAGCLDPYNS